MKLKIFILSVFLAVLGCSDVFGAAYKQRFNELLTSGDFAGQEKLLKEWEKADNADAELYIAYFNYYANKSRKETFNFSKEPKDGQSLVLTKTDGKDKGLVRYMNSEVSYDPDLLNQGYDKINKGIEKYPERLDMRFGKIYMYGETGDYKNFTEEIIKTIEYSNKNGNKWIWEDNKPVENAKNFMLDTIQQYQVQLFNTGNDDLLENMERIAETVLKYYPDNVESMSDLAIVFMIRKEYDKALDSLGKAEKLTPKDTVILNNIARAYELKGDAANAEKYYKLAEKYGNENEKRHAKEQIETSENK